MQRKLKLDRAASFLSTEDKPILFLDTCVMLDVFRVVERANSYTPFKVYVELANKVKNQEVIIVYNETVQSEFMFNAPGVVKEQRSKIQNLNRCWNAFRSMKEKAEVHHDVNLAEDKIIQAAEVVLRTIRKDALIVKDYDAALRSSYDVVLKHQAPAVRDSQFKDAYIFRTCLDLAKKSGKQIVFCSTNTRDYCFDGKKIHPEILKQANENNVIVALSLGEAYGKI